MSGATILLPLLKQKIKHTHIYVVRQLAYSTELLICINQSKKQYKQGGGENFSQLNSTHSNSLYFSVICSLRSLLAHKPQLFNVSNYRLSWEQEIMSTMNFHFVLSGISCSHHVLSLCAKWEMICSH